MNEWKKVGEIWEGQPSPDEPGPFAILFGIVFWIVVIAAVVGGCSGCNEASGNDIRPETHYELRD